MSFLLGWISSSRNDEPNSPKQELKIAQLILCSKCSVGDNSGRSVTASRVPMWVRWRKGQRWWWGFTMGGEESGKNVLTCVIEAGEESPGGRIAIDEGGENMGSVLDNGAEGEDEQM